MKKYISSPLLASDIFLNHLMDSGKCMWIHTKSFAFLLHVLFMDFVQSKINSVFCRVQQY
jgi:hypothetical protein